MGFLAFLYFLLTGGTTRFKIINEEAYLRARERKGKVLFALWHNRIFLLSYVLKFIYKENLVALVSPSRDGEIISSLLTLLKFKVIRGSSFHYSKKSFQEFREWLKRGFNGAITPDGPRGPKYTVKPGIIHLAYKTGIPIQPVTYTVKRKKYLPTWDSFLLPLPFNRGILVFGEPLFVRKGEEKNWKEKEKRKLEQELERITKEAEHCLKEY